MNMGEGYSGLFFRWEGQNGCGNVGEGVFSLLLKWDRMIQT